LGHKLRNEKPNKITMLFTHAHLDHLTGFPFFLPLFMEKTRISVMGDPKSMESYRDILNGIMSSPYFPVSLDSSYVKARLSFKNITTRTFRIGPITVRPVGLTHPVDGGLGFRFEEAGKSLVFLTDNELNYRHNGGLSFGEYVRFCRDADLLIHDAEYTKKDYNPSWGHSLFTDAVELAIQAGVRQLGLFHLNAMRTDSRVDAIVEDARRIIAKRRAKVKCFAVGSRFKVDL
jgi:ribonuclease BN (tRNA processing enzyme)